MNNDQVSAKGERAAMGGYLPQFDEFAWFVYLNLINKELEWIRISDPEAKKLDDIQYSTHSEIHAYQVKWTISEANISYADFIELLPLITSSWKSLKQNNPTKKVIPHLITNRSTSLHDSIKDGDTKIGSFQTFISEVWSKVKSNQPIDNKWNCIIEDLEKTSNLNSVEFKEFINCFDFQPEYNQKKFSVSNIKYSKEDDDLQQLSRFIIEQVASPARTVEFNRQEIINKLGWSDRFKTIFNHELIVDRKRYQPIQSTIDLLNSKLNEFSKGYLFLLGGPGSGKSTLLNQWSKGIKTRIVKYYAFDFVNPSSNLNFYERGNATHLFFDLVIQIKNEGIYNKEILPYKDIIFLKEIFSEQLKKLGDEYLSNGKKTIIIIDGLDHVPREYKLTADSFLRELPLSSSLPEGVYIILGSQTYELEDIKPEIKSEFLQKDRTIKIDSLKKNEVFTYIEAIEFSTSLDNSQKQKIFEISQGHPLYLSYLIGQIDKGGFVEDAFESFPQIDGDIDIYYNKIWDPIQMESKLIDLLGLIARINSSINLNFIREWGFERGILKLFNEKAKVLFNETNNTLSFFHNSFKQFLLNNTAIDYLTGEYDPEINLGFHKRLAEYYKKTSSENQWRQNYHLFQAHEYEKFVVEATPDSFVSQLLNFRPVHEIKQDAKLGVEIAKQTNSVNLLIKYLFVLAEIERRVYNIDPSTFTEELLILNKYDLARNYLRSGNRLHCSLSYALKASRNFVKYGFKAEGETLFNLAYPDVISETGITIGNLQNYDEIKKTLVEWVYTAPYFISSERIFSIIENIRFVDSLNENRFGENEGDLCLALYTNLGYSLIEQNKWESFNQVVKKIDINHTKNKKIIFKLTEKAIEVCLSLNDITRANEYLLMLKKYFAIEKAKSIELIYIADIIYKVTKDSKEAFNWIKDIRQPLNLSKDRLAYYYDSLEAFLPLIKLNKLLNLCDKGISITSATQPIIKGSDEEVLVEFERMLCLTTQLLTDGISKKNVYGDINRRIQPILRYYYKEVSHHNKYWYQLTKYKGSYYEFLIYAVSTLDENNIDKLGLYFIDEFINYPKYWDPEVKRKILLSLWDNGLKLEIIKPQLILIGGAMLDNNDIDGRISECLTHSKAWFQIGLHTEAEKWLKQAIQESIGVGYRKDYQYSRWIIWLRKINLINPENASERIKWFLSHLKHIKETTEGNAFWKASEDMLGTTFEYNLHDGFQQALWQLDHDLVDFNDVMALFIKCFTKRVQNENEFDCVFQLYTHLYLYISESPNEILLEHILAKGYDIFQQNFVQQYLASLVSAINIKTFENDRDDLLSNLNIFFSSKGISIQDYIKDFTIPTIKKENTSSYTNTLILKIDHEKLDEDEVFQLVRDFETFKDIIQKEDSANSDFRWSKVVAKITPSLSLDQIKEFVTFVGYKGKDSVFYANLSSAAFTLGDKELALNLANKSIELTSEAGWVSYYDGGSRIKAFSALKKVLPKQSSNLAFEVFANDIVNSDYLSSYIENLGEIAPLLTDNYNENDIWSEIFSYLKRLMSNSKPIENLPPICSISYPILNTLIDYLIYLSNNPIGFIKQKSTVLLARVINKGNHHAFSKLLDGCLDDYLSTDVLMYLYELKSSKLVEFKPILKKLALSKDYQIRDNVRQVLLHLNENIPIPEKITLPSIYSIYIPDINKPAFIVDDDSDIPRIDLNTTKDLIRPFGYLIKILSQASGINEYNLTCRAFAIMRNIANEELTNEYEKKLRDHLDEINIRYPFHRPGVVIARRAVMHIVSELIDSGSIDEMGHLAYFKFNDYSIPFFSEIAKPIFVLPIKEIEHHRVSNDWFDTIDDSLKLNDTSLNYFRNMNIIGEYSKTENLNWGTPTEEYMSQIAFENQFIKDSYYIFDSVFNESSNNYHNLTYAKSIIIIRNNRFDQFQLKSSWIAINPLIAKALEWIPEPTKLFAWQDARGKLMAESIYWADGNSFMHPPKNGNTGEGWFVTISDTGLEQIRTLNDKLYFKKKIIRSKNENSKTISKQACKVVKLEK